MMDLDRNLWLLFVLNLAVGFSNQLIGPLFPLYLESLSASEMEIGLVVSPASFEATALMLSSGLLRFEDTAGPFIEGKAGRRANGNQNLQKRPLGGF